MYKIFSKSLIATVFYMSVLHVYYGVTKSERVSKEQVLSLIYSH